MRDLGNPGFMVWFPLMVSCGAPGDELHMSEPRWAAINRDEARLGATNRDWAARARTPHIDEFRIAVFDFRFKGRGDFKRRSRAQKKIMVRFGSSRF